MEYEQAEAKPLPLFIFHFSAVGSWRKQIEDVFC
jgi:hypothetical protein